MSPSSSNFDWESHLICKDKYNVTKLLMVSKIFSGLFNLDARSGALTTAKALTGKGRSEPYSLTVRALDKGQPSLFTDVTLKLFIGDVVSNDGIPSFVHPTLDEMAYISEVCYLVGNKNSFKVFLSKKWFDSFSGIIKGYILQSC